MNARAVYEENFAGLLPLLARLDERLSAAVSAAEKLFAARAAGDLYRGLAVTPADVVAALGRVPGKPFLSTTSAIDDIEQTSNSLSVRRLRWLQRVYELSDFDLNALLLGLAPEVDLRYERLYAYLQDDVTRRRPSVDLALNLFCASAGEKWRERDRFSPDAPLLRHHLVEMTAHHEKSPLLARNYWLDEQIVRYLLLNDGMDSRLIPFCHLQDPRSHQSDQLLTPEITSRLRAIAARRISEPVRLSFIGPAHCGQTEAVAFLALEMNMQVLRADFAPSGSGPTLTGDVWQVLAREAWSRGALLHLAGIIPAKTDNATGRSDLWAALRTLSIAFVLEVECDRESGLYGPLATTRVHFSTPTVAQRERCWCQSLDGTSAELTKTSAPLLAERYRLNFSQIKEAAARGIAQHVSADSREAHVAVTLSAREQTRPAMAHFAALIKSERRWKDLVLPEDAVAQLREVCQQFTHRQQVFDDWGFGRKLSSGKGINVLFAGSPGTGKTMAAEVVANALALDLYKIDLAGVVSKYIGETEKNLEQIFNAASTANAILLFDEADALFGRRSEVKDARDRYANLEISYLLQKMEQYEGIAILATNLRENLDDAFVRRLAFIIHFPFPDEVYRRRIWASMWPSTTPLAGDVDLAALAKDLKLSGGHIRNVGLAAAFLAAADGGVVTMQHIRQASQREYQKLGKALATADQPAMAGRAQASKGLPA